MPQGYDVIRVVHEGEDELGRVREFVEYVPAEGLVDCNVAAEEQAAQRLALRKVTVRCCTASQWGKFVVDEGMMAVRPAAEPSR